MAINDKIGSKDKNTSDEKKKVIGRTAGGSATSSEKKSTTNSSSSNARSFGGFAKKPFGTSLGSKESSNASKTETKVKSEPSAKPNNGNIKVNLDPKTVQLTLQKISPASAAKIGFFISIALGLVVIVAALVFWFLLDKSGVLVQLSQGLISSGLGDSVTGGFTMMNFIIVSIILACLNTLFITLLSAIFAVIYNTAAKLTGGIKMHFIRG